MRRLAATGAQRGKERAPSPGNPFPGSSLGSARRFPQRPSLPRPPRPPSRARRAPQSSPAPKVSLMHLESASGSPVCVTWRRPPLLGARRAKELRSRQHFQERRVRSRPQRATSSFPDPSRRAPASPAPRPPPTPLPPQLRWSRRWRLPAAAPPHTRSRLRSFSSCAGEMSSVLFLYRASPRFRGPARRAGHALLICIGRRPLPRRTVPAARAERAVRGAPGRRPCV